MIQNALLAQYYTIMHTYCEDMGFPSPPPPMEEVIAVWTRDFKPAQQEVEAINCIARGRTIHQSMASGDDRGRKSSNLRVLGGLTNRRPSPSNVSSGSISPNPDARLMRIPSANPIAVSPPRASPSPDPTSSYTPDFSSSRLTPTSSYSAHSPAGPSADYFQRAAAKKKPPPPPPKRSNSELDLYATALYSFDGHSQGDLSFRENDRIRVIKKTDSTDDWWEGELRGRKGSFPANYCKIG
jgi:amphiphysin